MSDTLQKFLFEGTSVRGEFVDVSHSWAQIQSHRSYPPAVQILLGEMLSAAVLLSGNLKFDGTLILQIHGDGPIQLLVVECDTQQHVRATAKISEHIPIQSHDTLTSLINAHNQGRFVITLDPREKSSGQKIYQGIVPLEGDTIATIIEHYMLHSEQLETKIWLAADAHIARGLLLQKLPTSGGIPLPISDETDTWNRVTTLASTLKNEEILTTDIQTLMRHLFWEETVRIFDPKHPQFQCRCSHDKVSNMLKMLGQTEVDSILTDLDQVAINCDFCGQQYTFDKVDCAQLFTTDEAVETLFPPPPTVN